jgi:hypothetical protein
MMKPAASTRRIPANVSVADRASVTAGFQGFASPAQAALDPGRHLPEDNRYAGEALLRIARTRDSRLSLWSNWKPDEQGLTGR